MHKYIQKPEPLKKPDEKIIDQMSFLEPMDNVIKTKTLSAASIALAILVLIRMITEWQQKSFGYFFGFTGVGSTFGDPKYEMASAFP